MGTKGPKASSLSSLFTSVLLSLILIFPTGVEMVKREDFKRCDQSGFCVRQRSYASLADRGIHTSAYTLLLSTVSHDKSKDAFTADILDESRSILYTLSMGFVQEGSAVRVKMLEKKPLRPRFELTGDLALSGEPKTTSQRTTLSKTTTDLRFALDDSKTFITVHSKPFRFEVVVNGQALVSVNEFNYLNYEYQRTKEEDVAPPEEPETPEMTDDQKTVLSLKKKLRHGFWDETFGSNVDSKPFGTVFLIYLCYFVL
jgi:mannosyl-oligosaccharide alpha-1,3-glucosidase